MPVYSPHRKRGTAGRATDRAATGKGGVAKRPEEFQNGVLMRELLIRCAGKCGNHLDVNKKMAVVNNAAPEKTEQIRSQATDKLKKKELNDNP